MESELLVGRDDEENVSEEKVSEEKVSEEHLAFTTYGDLERRLRSGMADFFDIIALIGTDGNIAFITSDVERVLGHNQNDFIGSSPFAYMHPDDHHMAAVALMREVDEERNRAESITLRFRHLDGSFRDMETVATSRFSEIGGVVVALRDVTGRRIGDRVLAAGKNLLNLLPSLATEITMITDASGRRVYVSPSALPLLGYPPEVLVELPRSKFLHPEDQAAVNQTLQKVMANPGVVERIDVRVRTASGGFLWVEASIVNLLDDATVQGVVTHARDIDDRHREEAHLRYRAMHDPLTGLLNRLTFIEHLSKDSATVDHLHLVPSQVSPRGAGKATALLFCDLDGFKLVNDTYGHQTGDDVLLQVGQRLRAAVRPTDLVGRLGGDEFCVICAGLVNHSDAEEIAERILHLVKEPFEIDGHTVIVGVSIGIAWADEPGANAMELLARADKAMYSAKSKGRNRIERFS